MSQEPALAAWRVSILILNWNRINDLKEAIRSALDQAYPLIEVVVVDNGSTDGSADMVAKVFPEVKLVRLHRNVGCPEGRNIGFANCGGEIVFCLDNDGTIEPDAIEKVLAAFRISEKIAVVTINIVNIPMVGKVTTSHSCVEGRSGFVGVFSGGASAIKRELLPIVGYYPEGFIYGGEETYLSYKIFNADYLIYYEKDAVMYHKRSPVERDKKKQFTTRFRNDLATTWQFFPLSMAFITTTWKILLHLKAALFEKQLAAFLKVLPMVFGIARRSRNRGKDVVRPESLILLLRCRYGLIESLEHLESVREEISRNPSLFCWLVRRWSHPPKGGLSVGQI